VILGFFNQNLLTQTSDPRTSAAAIGLLLMPLAFNIETVPAEFELSVLDLLCDYVREESFVLLDLYKLYLLTDSRLLVSMNGQ
jgi:hypothetical protein